MDSDKLRHFPEPPNEDKATLREVIKRQTAEFLAKGGKITEVPPEESAEKHYPIKRTRKAQINFIRNRDYNRSNPK